MRSQWVDYKGKKIFYQNFAGLFFNSNAVKEELDAVQEIVMSEPLDSVLVLTDLRDTQIDSGLLSAMSEASMRTKSHVHRTAVLGVTGVKRTLGDLLSRMTGQPLMYFDNDFDAKDWLAQD